MDWAYSIERNRLILARIVAGLFAMAGLAAGGVVERLPRPVRRAVLAVLRPAESAVRRLIIVAAHGLKPSPEAPRVVARGRRSKGKHSPSAQFQLFDSRKRFNLSGRRYCKPGQAPRVIVIDYDDGPLVPAFLRPAFAAALEAKAGDTVSATRLCRRLAAIQAALEDLPKQAKRLVRWRARRAKMKVAKFRDPLRPGAPPGQRTKPKREVDEVLRECKWLVSELPKRDTS